MFLFSPFLIDRWEQNSKLEIIYRICPFFFLVIGKFNSIPAPNSLCYQFHLLPSHFFFPVNLKGLFLISSALKFHGGVPWCGSSMMHCAGCLMGSFNLGKVMSLSFKNILCIIYYFAVSFSLELTLVRYCSSWTSLLFTYLPSYSTMWNISQTLSYNPSDCFSLFADRAFFVYPTQLLKMPILNILFAL